MLPVLTPDEMAECDRLTIAAGAAEAVLIDRAAHAVARVARCMLRGTYGRRVVVAAGRGNNGADGRVAADLLRARGCGVDVIDVDRSMSSLGDDARRSLSRAHLLIDAMYGTGMLGRLEGCAAEVARRAEGVASVLAVDVPSGVNGLTGSTEGPAVVADRTVTFAALKPGLLLEPGRSHAGVAEVADIGVDPGLSPSVLELSVLEAADLDALLPRRHALDHKWTAALMIVAGSRGMTGAGVLAARGAQRAGAGMVVCGLPDGVDGDASYDELVTRALSSTSSGALAADAALSVLADLGRFGALVVGPGIGRNATAFEAARQLIAECPVPVVVDADALHALADDPAVLRVRNAAARPPAVLTPHEGEFRALAGRPVGSDRVAAARDLAATLGSVVVLKGPATVVVGPSGRALINPTGGPTLATPGTGDVLAGVIGALLARGLEPLEASAAAAWWHGAAADALAPGALAGDVAEALPRTLALVRDQETT